MGNSAVTLSVGNRHVRIGKLLAEGGYSFIYEAECEENGGRKCYILKRMRVPKDHAELNRIAGHEQKICRQLAPHPNVVEFFGTHVVDIGRDWDYYILMEACRGNVAELVHAQYRQTRFLSQRHVLSILRDTLVALEFLHERPLPIAHRDIKVENMLVGYDGTYKLCDFGSATTVHHTVTDTAKIPLIAEEISRNTTLAYRAPEQVDLYRQDPLSEKVDIWAVGCMLFKMMYFRTPYEDTSGNVEKIGILNGADGLRFPPPVLQRAGFPNPPFTQSLVDFIKISMTQKPTERPSAGQLLDLLDSWGASGKLPGWERTHRQPASGSKGKASANAGGFQPEPDFKQGPEKLVDISLDSRNVADSPISTGSRRRDPNSVAKEPLYRTPGGDHASDVHLTQSKEEWGQDRRISYVTEQVQAGVLGLLGGNKERQRWIIKATSLKAGAPKAKYIRRIIIAIWEEELHLPVLFTYLGLRPLRNHDTVAFKALVLLLKIIQNGPPHVLTEMASLIPNIEALCRHWAGMTTMTVQGPEDQRGPVSMADMQTIDLNRNKANQVQLPAKAAQDAAARRLEAQLGLGPSSLSHYNQVPGFPSPQRVKINENGRPLHVLIAKLAGILVRKLNFHDENPDFSSHFTDTAPGSVRAVPVLSQVHARTVLAVMLELQELLMDCIEAAARTSGENDEAVAETAGASLLPLVEESFTLLTSVHNLLSVEILLGRKDDRYEELVQKFRKQWPTLRQLYQKIEQHPQVRIFGRSPVLLEQPPLDDEASLERYRVPVDTPFPYQSAKEPGQAQAAAQQSLNQYDSVGSICIPLAPQAKDIFLARGSTVSFKPRDASAAPRANSRVSRKELTKKLVSSGLGGLGDGAKVALEEEDEDDEDEGPQIVRGVENFADFSSAFGTPMPAHGESSSNNSSIPPQAGEDDDTVASEDLFRPSLGKAAETSQMSPKPIDLLADFTTHDTFFDARRRTSRNSKGEQIPSQPDSRGPIDLFSDILAPVPSDTPEWTMLPPGTFDGPASTTRSGHPIKTLESTSHARAPSGGNPLDLFTPNSVAADGGAASSTKVDGFKGAESLVDSEAPLSSDISPAEAYGQQAGLDLAVQGSVTSSLQPRRESNPFDTNFSVDLQDEWHGTEGPESQNQFATSYPPDEKTDADTMHAWVEAMDPAEQEKLAQIWGAARQAWRGHMSKDVEKALEHCVASFEALKANMDFTKIRVLDILGTGAFATVYKAVMPLEQANGEVRNSIVAFKKLGTDNGQQMQVKTLRDFETEVDLLRRLDHPNIVRFLGTTTDPLGVVTEFCSRGNLMVLLHNERVALPWARKLAIVADTAKGMEYLHAQTPMILHRDLKSLNILIDENWTTKVTDFGLSRFKADSVAGNMTGQTGTYHWMAPEVINNEKYDERADIYSFGIILWETYGRAIPYEGMTPVQIVAAVVARRERLPIPAGAPAAYADLITRCWAHNKDDRPNFSEVVEVLEEMQRKHSESHRLRDRYA